MASVVDKDYVLRLARQIAELLARALALTGKGRKDEGLEVLERGCAELLGVELTALLWLDSRSAADVLGSVERIEAFAALVEAAAQVHARGGDEAGAQSRRQHALELYLEAAIRSPGRALRPEVRALAATVPADRLPERYRPLLNEGFS